MPPCLCCVGSPAADGSPTPFKSESTASKPNPNNCLGQPHFVGTIRSLQVIEGTCAIRFLAPPPYPCASKKLSAACS